MKYIILIISIFLLQNIIYAQSPALNVDECCCPELQTGNQDCAFGGQSEDTTIMVISTDITSAGANDGTFTVSGFAIYDMDFSTGTMADSVSSATDVGLSPGLYTVTVTDEENCIALREVVISEEVPTLSEWGLIILALLILIIGVVAIRNERDRQLNPT